MVFPSIMLNSIDALLVTKMEKNHVLDAAMMNRVMNATPIIISIVKRKNVQHAQHHVKHVLMNLINALRVKMVMD